MKNIGYFSLIFVIFLISCSTTSTPDIENQEQEQTPISQTEDTMNEDISMEAVTDSEFLELDSYSFKTDTPDTNIMIHPIQHATLVMDWGDTTIFIDPAEEIPAYDGQKTPDIVLVTHEHGDHFKLEVLEELVQNEVQLIVNEAVYEKLSPRLQEIAQVMNNGDTLEIQGFSLEAIAAYNIREEALQYHPKGRDNGYILEKDGRRVYISGDTEDTPEMRGLTDIDIAFVSMNLPYTMPIESAISGIAAFAPKVVFPYHFRGIDGLSDVGILKTELQSQNSDIEVILHNWYN